MNHFLKQHHPEPAQGRNRPVLPRWLIIVILLVTATACGGGSSGGGSPGPCEADWGTAEWNEANWC